MNNTDRMSTMVRDLPPSGIRAFFDLVVGMDDVISLGVGEPDFPTPWHICDASIAAMRRGMTSYTSNSGLLELREAISEDIAARHGVEYDPASEVVVTVGVSEALDIAMRAFLNPGDEVIVVEPCFVAYKPAVTMAGGVAVALPTFEADEFKVCPRRLEAAITPRTRALLLGYPSNPTGATMSREELAEVAQVAARHDLVVFSDEIYEHLIYEGEPVCFATLPQMRERTVVFNGFSKAYAMTGWRLGYLAARSGAIEQLLKIHQYIQACASSISQAAALEAVCGPQDCVHQMRDEFRARRDLLVAGFREMGVELTEPDGAFYLFPRVGDGDLMAERLAQAGVITVPGSAFGVGGREHIRISYAASRANLEEALRRMKDIL